ncbi:hypothetical protein GOP47_0014549 [Adiantum capillus-veneris]|uniref:Uncharacterized protein n=1 Tax=Adiantum capillus-veneris TaxID=13818 RepID=A0A9D4ULT6_ADICA|nr:hypothetical protein GOP47_0014549 [Adiantum capillus-veneris]
MEKRKRNGLEVTCIGVLYQGPWEKKYWSSSRGKDRYPYPVGYQAVRCLNGNSYHMEVQEGARGPLFVVASGQGKKCFADTPTIAWQDVMKKTSSFSKRTCGRLLSSDINGSELFGFLDPLVQRLFRELILAHEGEAQPDDISCSKNKADDVLKPESTMGGCPEGFGWDSTRTVQVRKSRTSIVRSVTAKGSTVSGESSLKQSGYVKGHRKRLKLVKPPKRTRENSETELSGPCEHSLPQILSPKSSQAREGCLQGGTKGEQMQEDLCGSTKADFQEIPKEEILKGTVIPDSYDDFPSQMYAEQEGMQAKLLPSRHTSSESKNQGLVPISGDIACMPGIAVSLSEPGEFEEPLTLKHISFYKESNEKFESENSGLNSAPKTASDIQLNNVVVPDSCDIKSQDLSLLTKVPLEIHLKNAIIPDSFDMESLNEAHSVTQGAVVDSQIVLDQASALFDKSDNLPSHSAKEESQSSEGNTQKGESDSLGQELTKSMISLLLPQALQIYDKKGRKRKKPNTRIVSEVEKVDLPSLAAELDEKESFVNPKEVNRQISEEQGSQNEDKRGFFAPCDDICAGTDMNQLNSIKIGQFNKPLNDDSGCDNNSHEAYVESSHQLEQQCDQEANYDQSKSKQPNSLNSCIEFFVDEHQATKDFSHQPMNCTAIPSTNPVPEGSTPKNGLSKGQLYNISDRKDVSSSNIIFQPPHPEEKERSPADQDCLQSPETEGICSPVANSLTMMEMKDTFVEGMQIEVEKGTSPLKVSKSYMRVPSDHILGFDAMESASKPTIGQEVSAKDLAVKHNELQPKHSVISTELMGQLAYQEPSNANDLFVEQRTADVSELEVKDYAPQNGTYVPKVCLEHPMPILAMKLTIQDDQVRLLICCGYQDATRLLLVYQMAGKELLPSIFSSTTFDILHCNSNAVCRGLVESNGLHFIPGRPELLLLGRFKIRELTEEKQASALDQKDNSTCDIQLVAYSPGKLHVASRLSSSGGQLYCVLPVDTHMVIAGGENGLVIGWIMDTLWRSWKESFMLPLPVIDRDPSSCIIQLSIVSTLPSIIVGCDDQGLIAIWNFVSRQLLKSLKLSVEAPSQLHILKMDLIVHSDCEESTEVSRMLDQAEAGSIVTEHVTASFLISTLSCHGVAPQDYAGQSVSKSWSLKVLKRDGNSVMFNLDRLQRICTVEISERLGLAGTNDGHVLLWDTMSGVVMGTLRQSKDEPVKCIAIDPACNIISVAGGVHALVYSKQM